MFSKKMVILKTYFTPRSVFAVWAWRCYELVSYRIYLDIEMDLDRTQSHIYPPWKFGDEQSAFLCVFGGLHSQILQNLH